MYIHIYITTFLCATYSCALSVAISAQAAPCHPTRQGSMAPKRSLIEAVTDGKSASKQARVRACPSVASQVQKAIVDNFKGFTQQEIDEIICDGLSLRARLTKDKAENARNPGTIAMGRLYYKELSMRYASPEHPFKQLIIKAPDKDIQPELFQAMLASARRPPQRQPMIQLLQNMTKAPNQSEVVVILRWMVRLSPTVSSERKGIIQTLRWVTRLDIHKTCQEEIAICKPHFEQGLLQALTPNIT